MYNEKTEELLEMLRELKYQAVKVSNDKNITVITDVSMESFVYVINKAIAYIREKEEN